MIPENLFLHPSAQIVRIDDARTQIRMPDGDSLTLTSCGFPMVEFVEALRGGVDSLDFHHRARNFDQDSETRSAVLEALKERNILVPQAQVSKFIDSLHAMFDYVAQRSFRVTPPESGDHRVRVVGAGVVADAARRALGKTDQLQAEEDGEVMPSLTLVCADFDHFSLFQEENEKAIGRGARALFVWKSGPRMLLGPLVRPRQSACFNCYTERRMSNTHFIEEFEAMVRQDPGDVGEVGDRFGLLGGLIEFLVVRQVSFVLNEVASVVKPGDVYSYHLITGETKTHPVLKLPRCMVCGRAREDALVRAVRDLL